MDILKNKSSDWKPLNNEPESGFKGEQKLSDKGILIIRVKSPSDYDVLTTFLAHGNIDLRM